ncbi:MAG TPA: site-specific integrase [Candidatus Dormibacteraeota bacterium]|nr:site-specific integrase [Candidatus Dormibacteraeota bacterium]
MATVVKRRGKWCVDFRDQQRRRHFKFFETRKEADDHLSTIIREVKRGQFRAPDDLPTFAVVAARWLEEQRALAPTTYDGYAGQVNNHLVPFFGPVRVDRITPAMIEDFRNKKWQGEGAMARTTVNQLLTKLTGILALAMRHDEVHRNAADRYLVKRVRRERMAGKAGAVAVDAKDVLTADQAGQLIGAAEAGLHRTFIQTALLTGCRSGELLGLVWDDIDLDARRLRVQRSLSWKRGSERGYGKTSPRFGPPKTDSSYRTIDLAPEVVRALRAWKLQAPPSTVALDAEGTTGSLVFPNMTGRPLYRAHVHRGLRRALASCQGLPKVDVHALRHTFASIAIGELKLPPTQVADMLGHKDASVTLSVYSHWFKGLTSEGAMNDLAAAILRPRGDQMVTAAAATAVSC